MTTQTDSVITTWQIDPAHTQAQFAVRHMMIATVKGRFARLTGEIRLDEADFTRSEVDVTIDAGSIDTRNDQRDQHLRSADFLDAGQHPEIRFRSTRIEPTGGDAFRLIGDLTIRGITHEVVLEVDRLGEGKSPWGQQVAGFEAHGVIDREQFGLRWNQALETGGVLVGNEVKLTLDVEAIRQDD